MYLGGSNDEYIEKQGLLPKRRNSDTASTISDCNIIYDKIDTLYESLTKQIELQKSKLKLKDGKGKSKVTLAQTMKQFKIFKTLVTKLKVASDNSGTLDDLWKYKEADEKLLRLKRSLAEFDETEDTSTNQKYQDHERASTYSCIGGSTINFYNDEDEAQELILEEDRLTFRHSYMKDDDTKLKKKEIYDDDELMKYQKVRKDKKGRRRDTLFNVTFSSDTVCLRYAGLILVFCITMLFVYILWLVRGMDHKVGHKNL